LAGVALIVAATALTKAADVISDRTKIGRVWIGAVLLAGATSLPELATDVSAVRMNAADLAAGDLFGSSMANMLILAVIDLLPPRRRVLRGAGFENLLAASLAIVLTAVAAVFVLTRPQHQVLGLAPESFVLLGVYFFGMRAIYRHGARAHEHSKAVKAPAATMTLRRAILKFSAAAAVILTSAPFFAGAAKTIAEVSGLGSTFVGTFLLGVSTSLPELVASLTAVRLGAFDLAVGNLFGSNAFNMVIFVAMDLAAPGPIFASLDGSHALSALSAVVLMALGIGAIVYRAERRFALLEPDSLLMVVVYGLGIWLLYGRFAG